VPWVQNSNETVHHGKITKRGPKELRTAFVQVVMGLRRMKVKTLRWRLMQRYDMMKQSKGSGKAIIATARKMAVIIWHMLTEEAEFELAKMVDRKLAKKAEVMSRTTGPAKEAVPVEPEKRPEAARTGTKRVKTSALPVKRKKVC
jgi:hypothetical protein